MNKGVVWTKGHKIKEVFIFPDATSDEAVNLIGQIRFIKYFENVVDPSIHVEITFADTFGSLDKFRIRSGSTVRLVVSHPSQEGELTLTLTISNIVAHTKDQKREIYTFVCEPIGTFSNHTTRVVKRYDGQISNSVKDILTEVLAIPEDQIEVDPCKNKMTFYGNYRRPFKVISNLCTKTIPPHVDKGDANSGTAGYLFYQTQDKYHFKSIDNLFDPEKNSHMKEVYKMTPYKDALNPENNFMLASEPNFKQSHDLIKKLRTGAFSSSNWYFDIVTRKFTVENNYKYGNALERDHLKTANEDALPPEDFIKPTTRFILGTLDSATTEENADGLGNDEDKQTQARHQAQASARYSAMFSQVLEFTIPMNLSLRVGRLINLKFPNLNTDKSIAKNSPESGIYMIARLSHELGNPDGDFTGLTLVRDSFTIHE